MTIELYDEFYTLMEKNINRKDFYIKEYNEFDKLSVEKRIEFNMMPKKHPISYLLDYLNENHNIILKMKDIDPDVDRYLVEKSDEEKNDTVIYLPKLNRLYKMLIDNINLENFEEANNIKAEILTNY